LFVFFFPGEKKRHTEIENGGQAKVLRVKNGKMENMYLQH
jgi:hypothetical protein